MLLPQRKMICITIGYIGSQADKFKDAASSMNELLTTMPELRTI
jgi:hypothetical protein